MTAAEQSKRCPHCGAVKPLGEFGRRGKGLPWPTSWCKECMRQASRDHRARNDRVMHTVRDISEAEKRRRTYVCNLVALGERRTDEYMAKDGRRMHGC